MERSPMNSNLALSIIRSGYGDLRPIIDYFAVNDGGKELADYVNDEEIYGPILYVLSELPVVDARAVDAVREIFDGGKLSGRELQWAEEILSNHG